MLFDIGRRTHFFYFRCFLKMKPIPGLYSIFPCPCSGGLLFPISHIFSPTQKSDSGFFHSLRLRSFFKMAACSSSLFYGLSVFIAHVMFVHACMHISMCSIITLSGRKVKLLRVITSCIAVCTSVLYVSMYQ